MADTEERIRTASQFILQAPPGEINDVLNGERRCLRYACSFTLWMTSSFPDVRNIIADDESLQSGILPALREYNLAQFITADIPGSELQVGIGARCREGTMLISRRSLSVKLPEF
jgi:capping protein alpha